jgi:hypothetical protein
MPALRATRLRRQKERYQQPTQGNQHAKREPYGLSVATPNCGHLVPGKYALRQGKVVRKASWVSFGLLGLPLLMNSWRPYELTPSRQPSNAACWGRRPHRSRVSTRAPSHGGRTNAATGLLDGLTLGRGSSLSQQPLRPQLEQEVAVSSPSSRDLQPAYLPTTLRLSPAVTHRYPICSPASVDEDPRRVAPVLRVPRRGREGPRHAQARGDPSGHPPTDRLQRGHDQGGHPPHPRRGATMNRTGGRLIQERPEPRGTDLSAPPSCSPSEASPASKAGACSGMKPKRLPRPLIPTAM